MAIPNYQAFMRPVLEAFASGRENVRDTLPDVIASLGLTADEAEERLPSGQESVVSHRAHWARTYMSKAGLIKSPRRNVHHITDLGRKLLDNHSGPIDNNLLSEFEGFEDWRGARSTETDAKTMEGALSVPSATTPTEQLDLSFTQIRNALADTLLERLRNETPAFFEQAVIDLLIAMGYGGGRSERGRAIGRSNDGGLDGVVHEDALGLDAVYVQAKRYAEGSGIGRPDIQQFVGSLTGEGASKGVFFTTSHFSSQARDYAARITQRVELIDGQRLARLMIDHKVGVRVERTFVVPEIDENFFTLD